MVNTSAQRNILIVDFGHLEVVSSFLLLFNNSNTYFFIITLPWLAMELEDGDFENITCYTVAYDDVSQIELIKTTCDENKIELVVLTTLESFIPQYDFLFKELKTDLWIYIHNANFWFKKLLTIVPRNLLQVRLLSLAKRANKLITLDERIKDYIETNFKTKKLFVIPTSIALFDTPRSTNEGRIRIVLPGNIQEKRRDYNLLVQLLPSINHLNIDLILLGKIVDQYSYSVLNSTRKLETSSFKIFSFDAYIPQKQYDQELSKADIVFAPIKRETDFFGIEEFYGLTKFTGIYADVIRHRKPLIAPSDVKVPIGYEEACLYYSNIDELKQLVQNIFNGKNLNNLQARALKVSHRFNLQTIKDEVKENA